MSDAARWRFTALDWIGVAVAILAIGYVASFPLVVAPAFRRLLADFGGEPPALTALALAPWCPPIVALVPATALVASLWGPLSVGWRRALVALSFSASAALAATLQYAMALPLLSAQIQ